MLARGRAATQDASSLSSHTRPKYGGVPTPESDTTSQKDGSANSRKRKWDEVTANDIVSSELLGEPFTVKPHPSSVHDKPRSFKSIAILLRAELPLSWLDRSRPSATSLPESRVYEASIKVLDLERRMGNAPSILVAQIDDKRSFYAIEYESKGLYTIFKLGSWVDLNTLLKVAVVTRPSSRPLSRAASIVTAATDDVFTDAKDTADGHKYSKKKKLAIEAIQSMIKRPSTSRAASVSQPCDEAVRPVVVVTRTIGDESEVTAQSVAATEDVNMSQAEMTPTEVFDSIRTQYLETLYLSKTSTAYFAKGPLSRARAIFQMDVDSTYDMAELITFLKSMVLTTTKLDKKYTKGLPECITNLDDGDDTEDGKAKPRKKHSIKKIKLGKNGLYTSEDELVRKWWENYDPATEIPATPKDVTTRSRISQIRIRETQLQMILILETLALERLVEAKARPDADLPGLAPEASVIKEEPKTVEMATTPKKDKKQQDLRKLINILVDRLSIWQSLSAVEETGAVESVEKVTAADKPLGITDKHAADVLRDFCVEVIIPFFSARLPSICDEICKKLGGPRISSPARPRPALKKAATTASARPGAAIQRPARPESLQKALMNERAQSRQPSRGLPGRALSLMRSATAPLLPGLKREASQTPSLADIPSFDTQGEYVSREGVQRSKKSSAREVDMSFTSLLDPAAKKANIDNEIKDAIQALKRPNRQLAGQTMAQLAEKRAMAGTSQSRKAKKPVRNATFEVKKTSGVLIEATPTNARKRDVFAEPLLPAFGQSYRYEAEPDHIPPSSISRVPSSSMPQRHTQVDDQAELLKATPAKRRSQILDVTPSKPPVFSRSLSAHKPTIGETPMRPPSRRLFENRGPGLQSTTDVVPSSFPPVPAQRRSSTVLPVSRSSILETPQKMPQLDPFPALSGISSPIDSLNFGRSLSLAEKEEVMKPAPLLKENGKMNEGRNEYDDLIGAWDNEIDDLA